jgi:hypothetical protein
MSSRFPAPLPRRTVVAAGLAAMVLGLPHAPGAEARFILARGMTGGGLAKLNGDGAPRLANFSLFASSMQFPEGNTLFLGAIRWIEAGTGFRLESLEITQCSPMTDRSDGAEIRGRMSVNGKGSYPFVIHAIDGGEPGSGLDAIELDVNGPKARTGTVEPGTTDLTYQVTATLVAGDVNWLIVDADMPS